MLTKVGLLFLVFVFTLSLIWLILSVIFWCTDSRARKLSRIQKNFVKRRDSVYSLADNLWDFNRAIDRLPIRCVLGFHERNRFGDCNRCNQNRSPKNKVTEMLILVLYALCWPFGVLTAISYALLAAGVVGNFIFGIFLVTLWLDLLRKLPLTAPFFTPAVLHHDLLLTYLAAILAWLPIVAVCHILWWACARTAETLASNR